MLDPRERHDGPHPVKPGDRVFVLDKGSGYVVSARTYQEWVGGRTLAQGRVIVELDTGRRIEVPAGQVKPTT